MGGREVTAQHVRDVRVAALEGFQPQGREVLHSAALGFSVDGTAGIKDPRGMFAETLTASFLVVSAPTAGLRNIVQCVSRSHLNVSAILAAPFAAGLACLVEDEAEQGAMVIDFGAGVTSAAAFWDGGLLHVETLPMGGSRATSDLAQGLGTTFAAAERMKVQHGAVGLCGCRRAGHDRGAASRPGRTARGAPVQPGRNRPDPAPAHRGDHGTDGRTSVQGVGVGPALAETDRSDGWLVPAGMSERAGRGRFPRAGASRQACQCEGSRRDLQFTRFRRCGRPVTLGSDGWPGCHRVEAATGSLRITAAAWSNRSSDGFRKTSDPARRL